MSLSGPVRNPFATVKEMPLALFYVDDVIVPHRLTGIKYFYIDDEGKQVVSFNWESAETVIKTGPENYAIYQNSRDVVSDT